MVAPQGINTSSTSNDSKAFTPVLKGLKNNNDISNTNASANATSIDRTYTDRYDLLSDWLNEEKRERLEDIKERERACPVVLRKAMKQIDAEKAHQKYLARLETSFDLNKLFREHVPYARIMFKVN